MAWNLKGTVLIACNCEFGCPCNYNAPPSTGDCEGGWTWVIDEGEVDGVRVDGLGLAVCADWPGAIHEGGGRACVYVDDRADDAQREALARLARGELGGPWGIFITTYELDGPHAAAFDVHVDGLASRYRIGDAAVLEMEPIRNPVTGAEVHPSVQLPEGLVFNEAALAASTTFTVANGVRYDHSGKNAEVAPFAYAG